MQQHRGYMKMPDKKLSRLNSSAQLPIIIKFFFLDSEYEQVVQFLQRRVKETLCHIALRAYMYESNVWDNTCHRND